MEKEWTIIFIIYADFREDSESTFQKELKDLLNDIKASPLSRSHEILIIQNIIDPKKATKDIIYLKRVEPQIGPNKFTELDSKNGEDISQKQACLEELFTSIHENKYTQSHRVTTRAKRYFLISWDHGSGFGIFRRDVPKQPPVKKVLVKELSLNASRIDDRTLLREELKPANFAKNKNGEYTERSRNWEPDIYVYYTSQKKFLFELNLRVTAERAVAKILLDDAFYPKTSLNVNTAGGLFITLRLSDYNSMEEFMSDLQNKSLTEEEIKSLQEISQYIEAVTIILPTGYNKLRDILTNEELSNAMQNGFYTPDSNKPGVDVLMMMNCYMLNVHACYAFRKNVNYLVAPQGGISEPGYNYSFILKEIHDSIGSDPIEPRELAHICVTSCGYDVSPERRRFKDQIEEWVIVAMDLTNYDQLGNLIDHINNILIRLYDDFGRDPFFIYNNARNQCARFDHPSLNYFMVDFTHWLNELIIELMEKEIDVSDLTLAYFTFSSFLDDNVVVHRIGTSVYKAASNQYLLKKPRAACIYFPLPLEENEEFNYFIDRNSNNQCLFIKEKTHWLLLLEKGI